MSYRVYVHVSPDQEHISDELEAASHAVLAHEAAPPGEMSIVLVSEERMRQFNLQYAGTDAATDVLAFCDGTLDPDSETTYHGDLIICAPIAARQAASAGHSLRDELYLLIVHGMLHLLGYDHDTEAARSKMWIAQAAILKQLGCSIATQEAP
jgi:probable rRNA maturation factor